MPVDLNEQTVPSGRNVRLDTLVRLRWLAVIGQTTAVLVVYTGLDFELPVWACLAVIALAAWLNVALRVRFRLSQRLEPDRAAWLLAFDIAEVAILLFLTGGLQNPFSFLLLGPVLLSATALPPQMTVILGGFAAACATVLIFYHYPLPWDSDEPLELPAIYTMGVWLSLLLALGFIGVHAWQLTEEARQLADALAATELVLAREQHLSQLDGLAAAAAHELGTPLATIALVAKELDLQAPKDPAMADDIKLLREQVDRCRRILAKLTSLGEDQTGILDTMKLSHLIEEIVAPQRSFDVTIEVLKTGEEPEPVCRRNPGLLYGLANLVDNAVDFAASTVVLEAVWTPDQASRRKCCCASASPTSRPAGRASAAAGMTAPASASACSSPRPSSNARGRSSSSPTPCRREMAPSY